MQEVKTKTQKIISYLSFSIGEEYFALNVKEVVNILEMQKITKIPKAPDYMPGIINLRGDVLPVIDTNKKIGYGATLVTKNTCILVVESQIGNQELKFGVLVDSVKEVMEISDTKILPPPSIGDRFRTELITGVVQDSDKFIMVININKLLNSSEALTIAHLNEEANQHAMNEKIEV